MSGKLFVYENVRVDDNRKTVNFDYRIDTDESSYSLTEKLEFPAPLPSSSTVDRLLRATHIALGISYYKTFIPPKIDHAYEMDETEATFWNDVFRNGLGEFLYQNKLSADQLARFEAQAGSVVPAKTEDIAWQEKVLLGIGGGKDSIVAGEIAKELGLDVAGFVLATGDNTGQASAVAAVMGVKIHAVKRSLDMQILELNKMEGAYNGHVPISLVFALVGCLLACIEQARFVVVANEASASIPQVEHEGSAVNHQWSKSLEFERQFQQFVHTYVAKELDYFSLIRPLTSIAVAKIFAQYHDYFETFTSDNSHFKIAHGQTEQPRWSLDSAKSLSSFILLAPWMNDEDLQRTFQRNFLDEESLEPLFYNLLGAGENAVLDCVGTPEELRLSTSILARDNRFNNSALMNKAKEKGLLIDDIDSALQNGLEQSDQHCLPEELTKRIHRVFGEKLA